MLTVIDDASEIKPQERYSIGDLTEWIEKSVNTYYTIDDNSMDKFSILIDEETGIPKPALMEVEFCPTTKIDNSRIEIASYNITKEFPLGPFNTSQLELKRYLHTVVKVEMTFWFISNMPTQYITAPFNWQVTVSFEREGSVFYHTLTTQRTIQNYIILLKVGWIPVLVIFFATISFLLGLKTLINSISVYRRTKKKFISISYERMNETYENLQIDAARIYAWDDIPTVVKMDFFSPWAMVEMMGEVLLIVASIIGLVSDHGMPISDTGRILTGIGCLIVSVNMVRYLEYWKKFYTLVLTLQGAFTKNLRFVISVVPIYMGYVACGHLVFGPYSDDFHTVDQTAVTLFALLNGDSIKDVFEDLYDQFPWPPFTRIYLYSFVVLFITAILNLFILMIEDAYIGAKEMIYLKEDRYSRRRHLSRDQAGFIIKGAAPEFDLPTLFDIVEDAEGKITESRIKRIKFKNEPKGIDELLKQEEQIEPQLEKEDVSKEIILRQILKRNRNEYMQEMERTMKRIQNKYLIKLVKDVESSSEE